MEKRAQVEKKKHSFPSNCGQCVNSSQQGKVRAFVSVSIWLYPGAVDTRVCASVEEKLSLIDNLNFQALLSQQQVRVLILAPHLSLPRHTQAHTRTHSDDAATLRQAGLNENDFTNQGKDKKERKWLERN